MHRKPEPHKDTELWRNGVYFNAELLHNNKHSVFAARVNARPRPLAPYKTPRNVCSAFDFADDSNRFVTNHFEMKEKKNSKQTNLNSTLNHPHESDSSENSIECQPINFRMHVFLRCYQ